MARPKKYQTEAEKLEARRASNRKSYHKNYQGKIDKLKQNRQKFLEAHGFAEFKDYHKTTTSYQKVLKNNQPEKFKTLYLDKPEVTRQHPTFTDYYIDTEGNAWKFSTKRGSWIKIKVQSSKSGYNIISLYIGKKRYLNLHHRIVAEAWIGPRPDGMEVDHIDRNTENNHPSNLRYLTKQDNLKRRRKWKWSKKKNNG
jgi:hypothetical protein